MDKIDKIIHGEFVKYGTNAKEWLKKCALMLPKIEKRKIWEKLGFSCIYEYAGKIAGMNKYQVNEALRVMKKVEEFPKLKEVIKTKGINAVKPTLSVINKENQDFWASKAQELTKNNLETYVREYKNSGLPRKSGPSKKTLVTMELDPKILKVLKKIKGDRSWEEIMIELLENQTIQKPDAVESKSHYIPAAIKKYVIRKYHGLCAFPGCCKEYEELHHTYRFSLFGVHDPDKIVPLCKSHHDLAHHGLIENETKPPGKWRIREYAEAIHPNFEINEYVQKCRSG